MQLTTKDTPQTTNLVDLPKHTKMLIPKRIQFETFYGCNARCTMCAISKPATRPISEMDMNMFKEIVDSLEPYKDDIEKVDLFGLGEPLMDKLLFDRINSFNSSI